MLFRKYQISVVHVVIFYKPSAKVFLGNCCVNGKCKPWPQKIIVILIFWITKGNDFHSDSLPHMFRNLLSKETKFKLLNVEIKCPEKWQCPWAGAASFLHHQLCCACSQYESHGRMNVINLMRLLQNDFFQVLRFLQAKHMYCLALERL